MWGKLRKRKVSRQLALDLLEDAMGRVEAKQSAPGTKYKLSARGPGASYDGPGYDGQPAAEPAQDPERPGGRLSA